MARPTGCLECRLYGPFSCLQRLRVVDNEDSLPRTTSFPPGIAWGSFCAYAVFHARARGIGGSARPVCHERLNQIAEFFLIFARGNFRGYQAVDVLGGLRLVVVLKDEQNMGVGASLFSGTL